jgi:outer membrane receptor protein involved in Fe transport
LNRVDLTGFELGGRFHVTDSLDFYGNLTYTYGRERFPDVRRDPADRIPPLNGSIGVLYRPTPSLVIEPFVQSAARQDRLSARDLSDPRINPQGTAGWVTANLRAQWKFNQHFSIKVAIENIGNQPYREHGSGINGPGRSMILALEGTL